MHCLSIKTRISRLAFLMLILIFTGCSDQNPDLILVSKDPRHRIQEWLSSFDPDIYFREFYFFPRDSMEYYLAQADGIVIGGGEDVNPAMYGKPEYLEYCGEVDDFRDSIETVLIRFALGHDIPLLGICRGQQIINAVAGGTLIPDLPTFKPGPIVHHNSCDSAHTILAEPGSWLASLIGNDTLWVNSRHHQALDEVSEKFQIAAMAPDGVIESIEIRDDENHVFAIAVQWHPESLPDSLSNAIGRLFIAHVCK